MNRALPYGPGRTSTRRLARSTCHSEYLYFIKKKVSSSRLFQLLLIYKRLKVVYTRVPLSARFSWCTQRYFCCRSLPIDAFFSFFLPPLHFFNSARAVKNDTFWSISIFILINLEPATALNRFTAAEPNFGFRPKVILSEEEAKVL